MKNEILSSKKTRGWISAILLVLIIIIVASLSSAKDEKKSQVPIQSEAQETKEQLQQPIVPATPVQEVKIETPQINTAENTQPIAEVQKQPEVKIPKYEIVYEVAGKRYDGAKIYYVLIDPISLKDDAFKNDIKTVIKKIIEEKGVKISVDIFDKKTVLESSYAEASTQKILTAKEKIEAETHYVAMFSGELKTNIYPNTLSFFGSTFTDNKIVGKYVETIEFNPSQN